MILSPLTNFSFIIILILPFLTLAKFDNWYYDLKIDDFDDSKISMAYSFDYYSNTKKGISLKLKCDLQKEELIFSSDIKDYITRYNYPFVLKYRIKPNKPSEILMTTWSNSYTGGYSKNEKEIKMLVSTIFNAEEHDKLLVRIRNANANEFNAQIDLSGAKYKIKKVLEDCKLKSPSYKKKELLSSANKRKKLSDSDIKKIYNEALGNLYTGSYLKAEFQLQQLKKAQPEGLMSNIYYWLGMLHFEQGNYKKAIEQFNDLSIQYPESKKKYDNLLKLGLSYFKSNQKVKACETLNLIEKQHTNNALSVSQDIIQTALDEKIKINCK